MTQTEEQPAGSFLETPLTTRLFRRISEPVGVIDVRHPEFLQERSTAGIVQRLDLLNQFKTRYGLTIPNAPVERASVAPAQSSVMRSPITPTQPSVMRSPLAAPERIHEFQATPQLRVKRPSEIRIDEASAPSTSANHPAAPSANKQTGTEASAPFSNDRTALLRASEIVAAPAFSRPQVSRQPQQHRADAENPLTTTEATAPTNRSGAKVLQQLSSAPATPASPSNSLALPVLPLRAPATPVISPTGELILRRKVTEQPAPAASTSPRASEPDLLIARSTPITPPPDSVSLIHPLSADTPTLSPMFLARKSSQSEPPTSGPAAPSVRTPNFAPIAQEVPVNPSVVGQASIIWRRTDPDASPTSRSSPPRISAVPGEQMMMRSSAGTSSPGLPAATLQNALTPSSSHAGVDVEHLAEHVSRVIARQLTVERERRGISR